MRRLALAIAILLGSFGAAFALNGQYYKPLSYSQVTAFSSAKTLGTIPALTTIADICNEGTALRYRDDGTAPTTTVGMILAAGDVTAPNCMQYSGNFAALQFIQEAANGGPLNVTFYQAIGQ